MRKANALYACLEFFAAGNRVASIQIVGGLLRWPERWKSDAPLIRPLALASFLKSRGHPGLSDTFERDEASARERRAAHEKWISTWQPAIPSGLDSLVEPLSWETHAPEPKSRPAALEILATQFPSIDERILKLFAWLGHGGGPWSGYPMAESVPELLLEAFTAEQLLHALECTKLIHQHLEGAARFLCRWKRPEHAGSKAAFVEAVRGSVLRVQILDHIRSTNDEAKIKTVEKTLP